MTHLSILVTVIMSIITTTSNSCVVGQEKTMFPKGATLSLNKSLSSLSKNEANNVIKRIYNNYKSLAEENNAQLIITNNWDNLEVSASANRQEDNYIVDVEGGIIRHPSMTKDSLAMVICHEVGHHFGGAPKYHPMISLWASVEGQSDYFASSKCFKKVFIEDDNTEIIREMNIPQSVVTQCETAFLNGNEVALCQRSAMASKIVVELLRSLRSDTRTIAFNTPDASIINETSMGHPIPQCRLDTYFSGTLCDVDFNFNFDDKDPRIGACNIFKLSSRPLCWYKPAI